MTNLNKNKIFNYVYYFSLACFAPLSYFAPLGEWLLLSFLSISMILNYSVNRVKINYKNLYIFLISVFIIMVSYYWSISPDWTLDKIGPTTGIIFAIYILLNMNNIPNKSNLENIIGIPIILTSICILSDILFNTEIRSTLAMLVGDEPTSTSSNFSRGIIILTILMPISIALYINKNKKILAITIFFLISLIVLLGPNDSSKVALLSAILASTLIYFLGPKSFLYFGIVSLIYIFCLPPISKYIFPVLGGIEKNIIFTTSNCNKTQTLGNYWFSTIKIKADKWKRIPNSNKCALTLKWQETSTGGSIIHRLLVWEYVGSEILKKPLLGNGIGTSRLIGQNIILNIPNTNQEIRGGIPLHPHNSFLEIWLELGLLGIIVISFIWIKIIKFGINIRKHSFVIGTGVCTSIVTIFVISNLSFGAFQPWWMASIGLLFLIILESCKYTNSLERKNS